MKYSFVAVALAAAVHAQTIDDVPSCAMPCLTEAITSESDCDAADFACACENIEAIRGGATACVVEECGAETALNEVLPAVEALCMNIGDGDDAGETPEDGDDAEDGDAEDGDDEVIPTPTPEPTAEPTAETTIEHTATIETTWTSVESLPATHPTHAPTNGTGEPTPIPTAGAAGLGSMGGIALAGLAVLAL